MGSSGSGGRGDGFLAQLEERFESFFEALGEHSREVLAGFAALLVLGGIAAWVHEWSADRRAQGFAELARIERELATALPGEALTAIPEDAEAGVAAQARDAREAALQSIEALLAKDRSAAVAGLARLRAASLEIDLGRLEAADARLESLAADSDGTLRGGALRLRGYVLEELGRSEEAADLYIAAGSTEGFASRGEAYLSAAEVLEREGELARAIDAFTAATTVLPELAQNPRIVERIETLRARIEAGEAPAPPASASTPETPTTSESPSTSESSSTAETPSSPEE